MKKLLVIDGNALLHRAYHAYPPLTNPKGEYVNAVYGFFSMILTVYSAQDPDYFVVCFDRPKPTFRQSLYAGYHANRAPLVDEFVSQIVRVHDILEQAKVAVFELDGYEADDLIGTIAHEAVQTFHEEVVIVTGDRDLLQLVNPQVKVLMPQVGLAKAVLFDEAMVEEKYGVHPRQFVDYKALIGDQSDGYPGVTGIGPKSAAKLLGEFETFENLYNRLDEVPEKMRLKLATDAEQAALAKKLAAIMLDVPIQFDLAQTHCSDFDLRKLRIAFREDNFKSLLAKLDTLFGKEDEQLGLL